MEIMRIIECQTSLYGYRATKNEARAIQLELAIDSTKPKNQHDEWDILISTPYRYSPPHREGRFRPPYGKNVFYGSAHVQTCFYEHAYHYMKERLHLEMEPETDSRTLFSVQANDKNSINLRNYDVCSEIMHKIDYEASYKFIENNPDVSFIIYPSCRDPERRDNAAILDINLIAKNPSYQMRAGFYYDNKKKMIKWIDYDFSIYWDQGC